MVKDEVARQTDEMYEEEELRRQDYLRRNALEHRNANGMSPINRMYLKGLAAMENKERIMV